MAGKITIRRIGSVVPLLLFFLAMIACMVGAWLSVLGFPDVVLRYIEKEAAAHGVPLRLTALYLEPARGLAVRAEGVRVAESDKTLHPLLTADRLSAGLNLSYLVTGKVVLRFFQINNAALHLPVTAPEGRCLEVNKINLYGRMDAGSILQLTNGHLELQGIPFTMTGECALDTLTRTHTPKKAEGKGSKMSKIDLNALREKLQPSINKAYQIIESQQWKPEDRPELQLHFQMMQGIDPDLRGVTLSLKGDMPKLEISEFHIRRAKLDIQIREDAITIENLTFHTIDPDTDATLRGSYVIKDHELKFELESTAPVLRMIRNSIRGPMKNYLSKFNHPDNSPPNIKMSGKVVFDILAKDDNSGEKVYSLREISVKGDIEQNHLSVGLPADGAPSQDGTSERSEPIKVEHTRASFSYDGGTFNIDQFELIFPDNEGSLTGHTKGKSGKDGVLHLEANLPVPKMLALSRELSPRPIPIPEGLTLGERMKLVLDAKLTAPEFQPGQTHWQEFVPTLRSMTVHVSSSRLAFRGYEVDNPHLGISLGGIEVNKDTLVITKFGEMKMALAAEKATYNAPGQTVPYIISAPKLYFKLDELEFAEHARPEKLQQATITMDFNSVDLPSKRPVQLMKPSLTLTVNDILLTLKKATKDGPREGFLSAGTAGAVLNVASGSVGKVAFGNVKVELHDVDDLNLPLQKEPAPKEKTVDLKPLEKWTKFFAAAALNAKVGTLQYKDTTIGDMEANCTLKEKTTGSLTITGSCADGDSYEVSSKTDWTTPDIIKLKDIYVKATGDAISTVLEIIDEEITEVEVPRLVEMHGECALSLEALHQQDDKPNILQSGKFNISIPELVRTPHELKVFNGERIPLAVKADVTLRTAADNKKDYIYVADLTLKHAADQFKGVVRGNTNGRLTVTGTNTIRPDVIDRLLDNTIAHSIIRDFRFRSDSKVKVSDIKTMVEYANGVTVDSFCNVELNNTEYLLSAMKDTKDGGEILDPKLDPKSNPNPRTLVSKGTCGVKVDVQLHPKEEKNTSAKDQIRITLSDIALTYDNAPWLRKMKIEGGTRTTRLTGNAVVIDVEDGYVELRNVQGTVYPAYSLGMFYYPLVGYLSNVQLTHPVELQTQSCVFPISKKCKRPMRASLRVLSPQQAGFRFIGTTIPLEDFSGFVYLTDKYVLLDSLNAKTWDGVLDAKVKIDFSGPKVTFDGEAKAKCMNLKMIAAAYGAKLKPALCNGEIRFKAASPSVKDVRAYGKVSIDNGDLMQLSIFRPVSELISNLPKYFFSLQKEASTASGEETQEPGSIARAFISIFRGIGHVLSKTTGGISKTASYIPGVNHLIAYDLQEASSDFNIINGHLITRNMSARGYNLDVRLNIDLDLERLYLRGNLWPSISSLPTLLLAPLTFLSEYMVDINIYGPINQIKWGIGLDRRLPGGGAPKADESAGGNKAKAKKR